MFFLSLFFVRCKRILFFTSSLLVLRERRAKIGRERERKSSQIDVSCCTDDRSRVVMGRLKWKDEEHLHVNAQLVPRISAAAEQDDHEAYDVLLEVATPFELVKNVSLNAGYGNFSSFFLFFKRKNTRVKKKTRSRRHDNDIILFLLFFVLFYFLNIQLCVFAYMCMCSDECIYNCRLCLCMYI